MGCCMSSTSKRGPPSRRLCSLPKPEPISAHAVVAPPIEEETVKEVLSETPIIPKPPQTTPSTQQKITQIPTKEEKKEDEERTPEISQASEMYSIADTYSSATTATTTITATVTEVRDDEVTSKKRVNRSPAKVPRKRPYYSDRNRVPKPLADGERKLVKRQLSGQARTTQQLHVGSSRVGRDLGDRSGPRSRSQATRTTASGAGKSRGGGSPAKVAGDSGSKPAAAGVGSAVKEEEKSQNDNVLMQPTRNESLDNPHVSLECFIFL